MAMGDYEIRIVKADGTPLVYACSQISDAGAIRSAENIPRGPGDRIEVWRSMFCVHCNDGLLIASDSPLKLSCWTGHLWPLLASVAGRPSCL